MIKYRMLAIFGIGTYIFSVLSSATDLEGNLRMPVVLVGLSGITTVLFIIMAVKVLWQKAKNTSLILASSAIVSFVLTVIQVVASPSYGSPIIILSNVVKVGYFLAFVWAIVKLFNMLECGKK
jgi:hypothetical protein